MSRIDASIRRQSLGGSFDSFQPLALQAQLLDMPAKGRTDHADSLLSFDVMQLVGRYYIYIYLARGARKYRKSGVTLHQLLTGSRPRTYAIRSSMHFSPRPLDCRKGSMTNRFIRQVDLTFIRG